MPKKKKQRKPGKEYSLYRVMWMCKHCGGEGGDLMEFSSFKEANDQAKEWEKDGDYTVEMEGQTEPGELWEEIE